jgi:hypothetical protein
MLQCRGNVQFSRQLHRVFLGEEEFLRSIHSDKRGWYAIHA